MRKPRLNQDEKRWTKSASTGARPGIGLAGIHQHLAHADERGGAAGGDVHAADEFQPAGLGCPLQTRQRLGLGGRAPGVDGRFEGIAVGVEMAGERAQEGEPPVVVARLEFGQQTLGQRHAGRLAATRQKLFAELDEAGAAMRPEEAGLADPEERPAAGGNRIQQFREERRAPERPRRLPLCLHPGSPLQGFSPHYMWIAGAKRQAARAHLSA